MRFLCYTHSMTDNPKPDRRTDGVPSDPIVAVATALAPAALGIVRASGGGALTLASRVFSRPQKLLQAASHTLVYGWILDPDTGSKIDEVVAAVYRAPAGFTGEEIEKRIGEMGLNSDFIHLESGYSRINVKMKDFDGTEINGQGPDIRSEETEKLLQKLEKLEATLWYWQAVFPRQCRSLFTGIYSDDWRDKEFWQW